jgi:hypothetical protein
MNANDLLKFLNAVAEEVKQNGRTLKDVTINFRRTDDSDVEVCDSIGVDLFDSETNKIIESLVLMGKY